MSRTVTAALRHLSQQPVVAVVTKQMSPNGDNAHDSSGVLNSQPIHSFHSKLILKPAIGRGKYVVSLATWILQKQVMADLDYSLTVNIITDSTTQILEESSQKPGLHSFKAQCVFYQSDQEY